MKWSYAKERMGNQPPLGSIERRRGEPRAADFLVGGAAKWITPKDENEPSGEKHGNKGRNCWRGTDNHFGGVSDVAVQFFYG
jgi:hypothetical protein